MPKVVFFTGASARNKDIYLQHAPPGFTVVPTSADIPTQEMVELVQDADFIMIHASQLPDDVFRAAKKLRLLQLLSAGYDNVDLRLTGELGIPVANVGGVNAQGVSEITITLMLAVYRRLVHLDRAVRQGEWLKDAIAGHNIFELAEKTVGIVGLGNIGRMVARRLSGFDVTILGYDVTQPSPEEKKLGIGRTYLDQLLRESDIVTLHIPLLPSTQGLIGERELSLMKSTAILINTSRGPVVDEDALAKALQQSRIGGAGLDVFLQEPINQDNPLLKLDNVVLTPHAAGSTYESYPRRADFAFGNMQRVMEGKEPLSLVRPE